MEQVVPGLWKVSCPGRTLPPYAGTECYWLVSAGEAILVDAGDGQDAANAALEESWEALGKPRVQGIYLTHHHFDHSGGAKWASTVFHAPAWIHPVERSRLVDEIASATEPLTATAVRVGDRHADILVAPGHAAGQINLWVKDAAVLLAGDNVLGATTVVVAPPDGNLRSYQLTLARLRALSPRIIGPGHGPLIVDGVAYLEGYIQHRR